MSKQVLYRQCSLSRKVTDGTAITTSWLPERYAVAGRYLELLTERGEWENGWHVDSVGGGEPLPENFINQRPERIWTNGTKEKKRKQGT